MRFRIITSTGLVIIWLLSSFTVKHQPRVLAFSDFEPHLHLSNDTTYLINFWASWCTPCVDELPAFEKISKEYSDAKVKVLLVSLDFPKQIDSRLIPFTEVKPDDDMSSMKSRAEKKGYTFPYLKDTDYKVYKEYGATRTPHIFVLTKDKGDLMVSYIGAIDDNYQDASAVSDAYLANAVDALLANGKPDPSFTKAIGCAIK